MEYKESDEVLKHFIEWCGSPELAVGRCFMALSNCYRELALTGCEETLKKFFEECKLNSVLMDWVGNFNDLAFNEIAYNKTKGESNGVRDKCEGKEQTQIVNKKNDNIR